MALAFRYRMWVMYNAAQLIFFACRPSVASADMNIYHHSEPGMLALGQASRRSRNRNLAFEVQQVDMSTETMPGLPGGTNWKKNFLCRTLGRCLLAQELESSPPHASPGVPVADDDIAPMTLPILPTDPEAPPPPAPRTNPSTLVPPNSHPSAASKPGDGGSSVLSKGGNLAGKVGISAGVSGLLVLMVALLYYFKPDIFMCCKTCVRVQILHHNHATKK